MYLCSLHGAYRGGCRKSRLFSVFSIKQPATFIDLMGHCPGSSHNLNSTPRDDLVLRDKPEYLETQTDGSVP